MPDNDQESKARSRELDDALEDTFPASDPPSMTSPLAATPSAGEMHQHGHGDEVRVYRVVSMADASEPFGADGHSHALMVPSALCPDEWNILLNPAHQDHAALRVARLQPLSLDERLAGG